MRHLFFPLLIAATGAAGCASGNGAFPSLAPRPIERIGEQMPPNPAPAVAASDAALDARLARLQGDLAAAAGQFTPAAARAGTLVAAARTAGIGSDAWLDAQTALAELDGIRAQSTAAMSALDELAIDRAATLAPAYPALGALHDKGEAQLAGESATIAGLQRQLPESRGSLPPR